MPELAFLLMLGGLVLGWLLHVRLTYRWRAGHRRVASPPRHRITHSRTPDSRAEPRAHQEDLHVDQDVLDALERLERLERPIS